MCVMCVFLYHWLPCHQKTNTTGEGAQCDVRHKIKKLSWFQLQTAPASIDSPHNTRKETLHWATSKCQLQSIIHSPTSCNPFLLASSAAWTTKRCCSSLLLHEIYSADFATGGQACKTSCSWGAISLFIPPSLSFHYPSRSSHKARSPLP